MKILKRVLFIVIVCAPVFMANIGCGPKVYVDEQTTLDTTTGEASHSKEVRVKD